MKMNTFNELHAEWLKDLSREDRAEARKAVAAGRAWAESGQSYDTLQAVLAFSRCAYGYDPDSYLKGSGGGLWDSDHDAAYDHYYTSMDEAVGDDDEVFIDHVTNEEHGTKQLGFFLGVGLAVDDMIKTAA
jgi:hypothetical protein